jgi:hypothetical protein
MPFCPVCGYEYEEGIEVCPDDDAKLVDHLTEEHFEGDMVEVYTSFSAAEAGMVKELLYNEGIFSAISNELGSSLFGGIPSSAGEVKVFVGEPDAAKAEELIEAYMEENPLASDEETVTCGHCGAEVDPDQEACPHCGEPFTDE